LTNQSHGAARNATSQFAIAPTCDPFETISTSDTKFGIEFAGIANQLLKYGQRRGTEPIGYVFY
jgi:hypothetical protein